MIYLQLTYNLSLLIALSVMTGFIGQKTKIKENQKSIMIGIIFGFVAIIGMLYPVNFASGLIFDGRTVVLSLCALFFGPVAVMISAVMAFIVRFLQGGVGVIPGVLNITAAALIGLVFHYKVYLKKRTVLLPDLILMGFIVHIVMVLLMFTLPAEMAWNVVKNIGLPVILIYPIATIMIGKIISDNLEKAQYLRNLKLSEEKYRMLIDNTNDIIYTINSEGIFTYVSPAWTRILGHSIEEVNGHLFEPFVHKDDLEACRDFLRKAATEPLNELSIEYRVKHINGTWRWHSSKSALLNDKSGAFIGFIGIARDITDKVNAELELKKNQNFYSEIIEHSGALIFVKDKDGKYLLINGKWEEATGLKRENVLGKTDHDVFFNVAADQFRKNDLEVLNTGKTLEVEETLESESGTRYFFSVKFPVRDENKNITGICGMTTETTEYRRIQNNFSRLSRKHHAVLDIVPEIIMEVDSNKIYTWSNKAGYEFFGTDVIGKEVAYYFEGTQDTYKIVNPIFEGAEEVIYVESWQRRHDGHKRMLAWRCKVFKDESGNVKGSISSARDITEQFEYDSKFAEKTKELKDYNDFMIDREIRMTQLKQEINKLLEEQGREPKY